MSIRFYNPPPVLLAKGNKEGVDIGGALSIIAMDKHHYLHIVEHIFSELSWGKFWEDPAYSDQIQDFTVKHEDNAGLFDPKTLIARLVNAFAKIRANGWIFYGIGDFESNSFMDALCMDLDYGYVQQLMEEHKRVRDQLKFPMLLDQDFTEHSYINSKFNGNGYQYFHYSNTNPADTDLYAIIERMNPLIGYVTGIVCTAQDAANFYVISETMRPLRQKAEIRMNTNTLDEALDLIRKDVIYPISWFRIDLNLGSLKTLEQWNEIKDNEDLKFALRAYFDYVKTDLKEEHDLHKQRKKNQEEIEEIKVSELSAEQIVDDISKLEELFKMDDLGLFDKKTEF
ncbi:MAG: hypothetical protein EU530_02905 [Promethearchaeota archaeon]|nr:MAG: hypothetical protein EU530_02905 [Candidatus Lokiarchaeota archaeon]